MKPGTKVIIKIPTWFMPGDVLGVVADKNLTEGLISVHYLDYEGEAGTILDFDPSHLEIVK